MAAIATATVLGALGAFVSLWSDGGTPQVESNAAAVGERMPVIGEELTVGRLAVTVTRFDCRPDSAFPGPSTPAQLCDAALTVRNDGIGAQEFPGSLQRIVDGFRRFPPSKLDSPDVTTATHIDPGRVVQITLVFRLPQTLQPSRLELRTSSRENPVGVSLLS